MMLMKVKVLVEHFRVFDERRADLWALCAYAESHLPNPVVQKIVGNVTAVVEERIGAVSHGSRTVVADWRTGRLERLRILGLVYQLWNLGLT